MQSEMGDRRPVSLICLEVGAVPRAALVVAASGRDASATRPP